MSSPVMSRMGKVELSLVPLSGGKVKLCKVMVR